MRAALFGLLVLVVAWLAYDQTLSLSTPQDRRARGSADTTVEEEKSARALPSLEAVVWPCDAPITEAVGVASIHHMYSPVLLSSCDVLTRWSMLEVSLHNTLQMFAEFHRVYVSETATNYYYFDEDKPMVLTRSSGEQHAQRKTLLTGEMHEALQNSGQGPYLYYVGHIHDSAMFDLMSPFVLDIDKDSPHVNINLWISSANVHTVAHYTSLNNMLTQLRGERTITLIPPTDSNLLLLRMHPFLHPLHTYSQRRSLPELSKLQGATRVVLRPGDTLYIPAYTVHCEFTGSSPSVSINSFSRVPEAKISAGGPCDALFQMVDAAKLSDIPELSQRILMGSTFLHTVFDELLFDTDLDSGVANAARLTVQQRYASIDGDERIASFCSEAEFERRLRTQLSSYGDAEDAVFSAGSDVAMKLHGVSERFCVANLMEYVALNSVGVQAPMVSAFLTHCL